VNRHSPRGVTVSPFPVHTALHGLRGGHREPVRSSAGRFHALDSQDKQWGDHGKGNTSRNLVVLCSNPTPCRIALKFEDIGTILIPQGENNGRQ
jgi:hypothetical protein